ncbi:MAG: rhodanese-like domain-containing protein [Bacteroidota bacterium]
MNQKDTSCKTPRWFFLKAQLNNLGPDAFKEAVEAAEPAILIDVRTPKEYEEDRMEGALNISYFDENLWEQLEHLDKTASFFVYCRSGRRSIRVCTLMRNGGFDNSKVFNLDGGMLAWRKKYPL